MRRIIEEVKGQGYVYAKDKSVARVSYLLEVEQARGVDKLIQGRFVVMEGHRDLLGLQKTADHLTLQLKDGRLLDFRIDFQEALRDDVVVGTLLGAGDFRHETSPVI